MCGLAYYADSYIFLAFARALSGVGEAGVQCSVPPWITRYAGTLKGGTWLAIFYTAIPVGTACGYAYSALVSEGAGWQWAFWIEGLVMVPFVLFFYYTKHYFKRECDNIKDDEEQRSDERVGVDKMENVKNPVHDRNNEAKTMKVGPDSGAEARVLHDDGELAVSEDAPNIWDEVKIVTSSPIFVMVTLGYAAQTGALIGLSTFGSSFVMALGYFDKETEASSFFGVIVSVAGILGTPLGGWLMDRWNKKKVDDGEAASEAVRLETATTVITGAATVGAVVMCMLYFTRSLYTFMVVVAIGCATVFATTSGINIVCMLSVAPGSRSFAIAFMTVIMHAFGDVPSPIIAGYLKDEWAPGCTASGDDDKVAASDSCRDDKEGIRLVMLTLSLWLGWCILFFGLARTLYRSDPAKYSGGRHSVDRENGTGQPLLKSV